jgi:hypothetical protein
MDDLPRFGDIGHRVDRLMAESAALCAETRRAIEEARLLRTESRRHAKELRALHEGRMALQVRG